MSLPRELRLINGRLVQSPVAGFNELRDQEIAAEGKLPDICELNVKAPEGVLDLKLFTKEDGSGGLTVHYDEAKKTLVVDKAGLDKRFNQNVGEALEVPLDRELDDIRVIIDRSSVEMFINGGEAAFTAHVYPTAKEHNYTVTDGAKVQIWTLKPSVKDNFII